MLYMERVPYVVVNLVGSQNGILPNVWGMALFVLYNVGVADSFSCYLHMYIICKSYLALNKFKGLYTGCGKLTSFFIWIYYNIIKITNSLQNWHITNTFYRHFRCSKCRKKKLKTQISNIWSNFTASNDSFGVYRGINSYSVICRLCVNHNIKSEVETQDNSMNFEQETLCFAVTTGRTWPNFLKFLSCIFSSNGCTVSWF
jgi:hypothetical protein